MSDIRCYACNGSGEVWSTEIDSYAICPHCADARLPHLPGLKGRTYYAKDSDGQWFYINHSGSWQTCPPFAPQQTRETGVSSSATKE